MTNNKWIEWRGGECPVPGDTLVNVRLRSGNVSRSTRAAIHHWDQIGSLVDVVAYRVVQEEDQPKVPIERALEAQADGIDATLEERGKRYGKFTGHARITQSIKRAMASAPKYEALADDQKEALEMLAHKIGRILNGDPNYHDSWHDIVGYTKLVADRLKDGVEV